MSAHSPSPPLMEPPARTSGLAIAGMIAGFFGCLILPAVAGLTLSIIALLQIGGSNGRIKGAGFAITGIVLSFLTLPSLLMVGILLPAVASGRHAAKGVKDRIALVEVATAMEAYQRVNDGAFPPADQWEAALTAIDPMIPQYLQSWNADETGRCFAMNASLDGLAGQDLTAADSVILIFECDPGARVAGGPELLPGRPRASMGYLIMTADGHVDEYSRESIDELLDWTP